MDMRPTTYSAAEAKAQFSSLLDRVAAGESIIITRHGKPVARLGHPDESESQKTEARRRARESFIAWRREHGPTLGNDITVKDLINEGRR
jgi:antitoxin (DNA-binding transcriptional repressor) of toxin-antitoxin stability system